MALSYCSVEDIKFTLPDIAWPLDKDAMLSTLCADASRAIDGLTKREPGAFQVEADTVRYFDGCGSAELWIPGGLADTPTLVEMSNDPANSSYTSIPLNTFYFFPANAALAEEPYLAIVINPYNTSGIAIWYGWMRSVRITGKFGFTKEPPALIKRATITQVCRWYMRGQQGFQDLGGIAELGQKTYSRKDVDPDIAISIDNYTQKVV